VNDNFLEIWPMLNQYPSLRRREILNLVLMKWLMSNKGLYDESLFKPEYPPASEYPTLPYSYEYKAPVSQASHS